MSMDNSLLLLLLSLRNWGSVILFYYDFNGFPATKITMMMLFH
jgi:hypothetical protein